MQSDFYQCKKCGSNYEEFDSSTYEHICPDCKGRDWKELFIIIVVLLVFLFLVIFSIVMINALSWQAPLSTVSPNESQKYVVHNFSEENKSEDDFIGYSYEENQNDPNCWTNINFCNIDFNITHNTNSYSVINILKQVNYQQQTEINKLKEQIDSNKYNKPAVLISLGVALLMLLWSIYITWIK